MAHCLARFAKLSLEGFQLKYAGWQCEGAHHMCLQTVRCEKPVVPYHQALNAPDDFNLKAYHLAHMPLTHSRIVAQVIYSMTATSLHQPCGEHQSKLA